MSSETPSPLNQLITRIWRKDAERFGHDEPGKGAICWVHESDDWSESTGEVHTAAQINLGVIGLCLVQVTDEGLHIGASTHGGDWRAECIPLGPVHSDLLEWLAEDIEEERSHQQRKLYEAEQALRDLHMSAPPRNI